MSKPLNQIYPDQAIAICTREQAEQLVTYHHHRVILSGRVGLLLTNEWIPIEGHVGPFILTIVFHKLESHPVAPESIQTLVDGLKFQIRGQPR